MVQGLPKIGLLLPLLAALSASEPELPLIRAAGTSLDTFEIELRLEAIDHATAEGLAKSFARFEQEQHDVRRRFAGMVAEAHLDLMRGSYTRDLVDRQAQAYDALVQKGYHCDVASVTPSGDKAMAVLQRSYVETGKQRAEAFEIELRRDAKGWWIGAIRNRAPDGKLVLRGLGTPPELKSVPVPSPLTPDLSSAKTAVATLRDGILRLGALRDNASKKLNDRFFDITAAFYGDEVARKARAERPEAKPPLPSFVEIADPAPRLADLLRVEVTVLEEVPGGKDLRSAIGQVAFDLRPEEGKWKVVGEFVRPQPDKALAPIVSNFGLFFLVRR